MSNVTLLSLRKFQWRGLSNTRLLFQNYSKVAITDDGTTFVAFHPEPKFPYELSKPIPMIEPAVNPSVLRMDDISEVRKVFTNVLPSVAREELMRITNTTKHRWFPRSRDKRAKKTPMDREYL